MGKIEVMECFEYLGSKIYCTTKEYEGITDSNSPTGPNESVCLATLLLL